MRFPQGGSGVNVKINFQPAPAIVPMGYFADTGAVYGDRGNGYTYGWNADSSAFTRDRGASNSPDQRYDTLNHMQLYGVFTWEIAVPNGAYDVHVVVGDPQNYDSVYRISVESVLAVEGTPSSVTPWFEGTQRITVTDGKLTIGNAPGASNNKICFVDIASACITGNCPPATPTITAPGMDGQIVHPADVHMETAAFSDPNPGDTHACTDWEIRTASSSERVWSSLCNSNGTQKVHIHLGDGVFENSYVGRTELNYDTDYILRVRHKDSSGDPATAWSSWAGRPFHTASTPPSGGPITWSVQQPGFQVELFATGFELPVNIAFVPNPGPNGSDAYLYVTELYGTIKVVTRDGTVSEYLRGALNYRPSGIFPGSGEQGLAGIVVDPASGDVFVSMLYDPEGNTDGPKYPKVVRYFSHQNGKIANTSTTILDMAGEDMYESHQISNLSIGPDGKLYVHVGDGFTPSTGQNLNSFRGKILRMNLDGSPATDNPFYDASDGINAKDYIYSYGFRNPFGGAWRKADNFHYAVENGPSVDRFAKVVRGRNYLWDGTDASMYNFAIFNWSPATSPVNIAFVQPETFNGSGFPAEKMGHAFVSESGPTWATGPQGIYGKRVSEFVLDANGNRLSGPTTLIEYTGTGKATVCGLTAGPDGLYFTELYVDQNFQTAVAQGASVLRVKAAIGSAPVAPSNLTATPGNAQVALSWTASSRATSYNVKRATVSGGPHAIIATGVPTPSHTDTTVTNGTTYYYVVSAVNPSGESPDSTQTSATPGCPVLPAPTGLAATPGNAQVALSWSALSGASSYNVKRATVSSGPYTTIASGVAAPSYSDTTVANGSTYYYVVSAANSCGASPNSTQVSATPQASTPPAAPTGLSATSRGRLKIQLKWTQSSSSGVTQNRIYRSVAAGGPYVPVATIGATTSYNDTSVTEGTSYYYVVTALSGGGLESAYSNQASDVPR